MTENNEYKPDITSQEVKEIKENIDALKQDFIDKNKVQLTDEDITVFRKPRRGCRHCYGTGVEGVWASTSTYNSGELKLCRCITNLFGRVFPNVTKEADTNRYLTFGAFRKMMGAARIRYNIKESENEQVTKDDVVPVQRNDQEGTIGRVERQPAESNKVNN